MPKFRRSPVGTAFFGLLFCGFQRRHLYLLWSVYLHSLPIISFAKSFLFRPGFEPGLLWPQRSVLTTRRSGPRTEAKNLVGFYLCFLKRFWYDFFNDMVQYFSSGFLHCFFLSYFLIMRSVSYFCCRLCVLPLREM